MASWRRNAPLHAPSHGVKATAQVLVLALTLGCCQPTAASGCWLRGGPSGTCSPVLWTTATQRLPFRCLRGTAQERSREQGSRRAPWASGHLQPQLTQRLTISLELVALQQLLLGQQTLIRPREALLDHRDHLLDQVRDLFLSIGLHDPGAAQRQPTPLRQDPLVFLGAGFEQQERILLRPAERRGSSKEQRAWPWNRRRERRSDGSDPSGGPA